MVINEQPCGFRRIISVSAVHGRIISTGVCLRVLDGTCPNVDNDSLFKTKEFVSQDQRALRRFVDQELNESQVTRDACDNLS